MELTKLTPADKKILSYIISNQELSEGWNKKIYVTKEKQAFVYIDNVKHDITNLYYNAPNANHIDNAYCQLIQPLIEAEFDWEDEIITKEEFEEKKKKTIEKLR